MTERVTHKDVLLRIAALGRIHKKQILLRDPHTSKEDGLQQANALYDEVLNRLDGSLLDEVGETEEWKLITFENLFDEVMAEMYPGYKTRG